MPLFPEIITFAKQKELFEKNTHNKPNTTMRKIKLISIVAVSLIVLAFLVFKFLVPKFKNNSHAANETATQEETQNVKAAPVAVEAVPAHRGDLVIRISASGQKEAVYQLRIMPLGSGTLAELTLKNTLLRYKILMPIDH